VSLAVDGVTEGILGLKTERTVGDDGITGVGGVFALDEMLGGGVL